MGAKSDHLRKCMRDAYEDFAELLIAEIALKNPKSRAIEDIKKAVIKVMEAEFGKDPGGIVEFD